MATPIDRHVLWGVQLRETAHGSHPAGEWSWIAFDPKAKAFVPVRRRDVSRPLSEREAIRAMLTAVEYSRQRSLHVEFRVAELFRQAAGKNAGPVRLAWELNRFLMED